jgi:DNA-directed RNA polymerase subunit RPC12/RpoP
MRERGRIIHRKANYKHALCGARVEPHETSLNDKDVNCEECLKKLQQISSTESKTRIIQKIKLDK